MIGKKQVFGMSLTSRCKRFSFFRFLFMFAVSIAFIGVFVTQPSCAHYAPTEKQVSPERLRGHVAVLSQQFVPRDYRHVENLDKCAAYIADQFEKAGGNVSFHAFEVKGQTYKNITASFGDSDKPRIVVGAHYDAFGETPGADDNASGVSGLIELAYLLKGTELNCRVDLVAFALEEPPFFRTADMGSARYAASLRDRQVDVKAMLCLEMIGFFSEEKGSQRFPSPLLKLFYPSRGNYIAVAGSTKNRKLIRRVKHIMNGATDLPVHSISAPRFIPGMDFSDHLNFWEQGYDAVMITDTAFYRNSEYHGANDTMGRLDFVSMSKVVLGVYEAVVWIANDNES